MRPLPRITGVWEVTDETFDEDVRLRSGKVFLVAGATWCSDTRNILEEVLPEYVRKYGRLVSFLLVEIEGEEKEKVLNPIVKAELQVDRYPTLAVYVDGQLIMKRLSEESKERGTQEKDVVQLLKMIEIG